VTQTAGASPTPGAATGAPWPTELRFRSAEAELRIAYDDGFLAAIPYELLRVESPSAETRGHGSQRPAPPPQKRKVGVRGADPVGRYAVRIRFDDGHDTGLYTWAFLRELAEQRETLMATYLRRLKEAGLERG
jgi:DUF971 family protein